MALNPLAGQGRRLVGAGLQLEVTDQAYRALRVQGGVDLLQCIQYVIELTLDIGAGCMCLHDEIMVPEQLDYARDFSPHRDTRADRYHLEFGSGFQGFSTALVPC